MVMLRWLLNIDFLNQKVSGFGNSTCTLLKMSFNLVMS